MRPFAFAIAMSLAALTTAAAETATPDSQNGRYSFHPSQAARQGDAGRVADVAIDGAEGSYRRPCGPSTPARGRPLASSPAR